LGDETGDPFAAAVGFVVVGRVVVEAGGEVVVAEPDDGVLAGEDGSEEGEIGAADGVEAGVVVPAFGSRPAQGVEGGDAFALRDRRGQGVEVAPVGARADLVIAPEVGHSFSHGTPPPLAPAVLVGEDAQHPELARIVGGLDA